MTNEKVIVVDGVEYVPKNNKKNKKEEAVVNAGQQISASREYYICGVGSV